jgi:hypothetical protein
MCRKLRSTEQHKKNIPQILVRLSLQLIHFYIILIAIHVQDNLYIEHNTETVAWADNLYLHIRSIDWFSICALYNHCNCLINAPQSATFINIHASFYCLKYSKPIRMMSIQVVLPDTILTLLTTFIGLLLFCDTLIIHCVACIERS